MLLTSRAHVDGGDCGQGQPFSQRCEQSQGRRHVERHVSIDPADDLSPGPDALRGAGPRETNSSLQRLHAWRPPARLLPRALEQAGKRSQSWAGRKGRLLSDTRRQDAHSCSEHPQRPSAKHSPTSTLSSLREANASQKPVLSVRDPPPRCQARKQTCEAGANGPPHLNATPLA